MPDTDIRRKRCGWRCAVGAAAWLLAAVLAAGCQDEQEVPDGGDDAGLQRLGISALYAYNAGNSPMSVTRAVSETPVPTDAAIGFFQQADGSRYEAKNNLHGAYNAIQGCWVPDDSLWLNGNPAHLAVYYPYDAAQTEPSSLNLTAAWRADATKDLWCSRFKANNRAGVLALTLTQLYSRLTLAFVQDTAAKYTGVAAITQVKLEGDSIFASGAFNPLDSVYTYGASGGFTAALTGVNVNSTSAESTAGKVDLLLLPCDTLGSDITVTATVDGVDMKLTLPKAKFADALLPGKQYTVTVKLRPMALEVAAIRTNEWDSQTPFTGDAGFVKEKEPHAIDIGLPFYIADGNLVGTKQADGTITYDFAEGQYWTSGKANGGDYFCWNELDPTKRNVTQSEWSEARDPCRQLPGGEWYTPTEKQTLVLAEGIYHTPGTWTKADGTTVSGMYFGTNTPPEELAEQGKFVFLPAGGLVLGNSLVSTGAGNYWSSRMSGAYAYQLYFNIDGFASGGTDYNAQPSNGLFVRCVLDK